MKRRNEKKDLYVIISYILLLSVIPITLFFSKDIGHRIDKYIADTMENSAEICAEMIERQYTNDMHMLDSLAIQLSESFDDNPELAVERMASFAERYNMKRVAFSYPDGVTLTTDGSELNMKGGENFEKALLGERVLSGVIVDRADGKLINVYVIPVYDKSSKDIIGVLAAVYNSETFQDILAASSFDGEGYTCIINSMGEVVINSRNTNAIKEMENINDYIAQYDSNAADLLKRQLKNKGEGLLDIKGEGQGDLFTYYKKINIADWYVFSMVPENIVEENKVSIMNRVFLYCMGILVCAIFVTCSIRYVLKEKNKQLKTALYVDAITGGRSYQKFFEDCKEWLKKYSEKNAAFVFLDIDNFNLIATLYGYEESIDTIRRIYGIIQNWVGEKGIVARNSSEQFCVMYFYDELEQFEIDLDEFVKAMHDNVKFETMLRPSIGIYLVEEHDEELYSMLNKARIAHETVKHAEGSIIAYYDAGFRDKKYYNVHMIGEMESALRDHEFIPYLQAKYNAKTGEICGAEALIRWITPEGKIIPPGQFIPLAENSGFVRELDKEIFKQICNWQKSLIDAGIKPLPVSVNVSRQLLYDKNVAEFYCEYVKELNIPAELIELEITESAFFEDMDLLRTTIEKFRNFGFHILMDDFGTGYSSLMMLNTVPIDVIKLDKSFIDDYTNEKGKSIIQCVLNLASTLKLPVVAEGVETQEQYYYLKESGCNMIQGFYFSKPIPIEEFFKMIKSA